MNNHKLVNLSEPTEAQDAATRGYVKNFTRNNFLKIDGTKAKKKLLCCPLPTDRKMRKNRVGFFFFFCQIWAKNLLKFVFNGLKKNFGRRIC